jgi:hypothetical protein
MPIVTEAVRNALVFRDDTYPHRWYDAIGAGVIKYCNHFVYWAVDDTTHDPTEWTNTIVEVGAAPESMANLTDIAGGALLISTSDLAGDGYSMQLGHASTGAGECVLLSAGHPCYFGIRFAINDVSETGFLAGLCSTDTALLAGIAGDGGVYFRSTNAVSTVSFVTEAATVEGDTIVATLLDDVYMTLEYLYDGAVVYAYVNGQLMASTARTDASFPGAAELRLSIEFLTNEAVADTCTVDWIRFIHIRD